MLVIRCEATDFRGVREYASIKDNLEALNGYDEVYQPIMRHIIIRPYGEPIITDWVKCCCIEFYKGSSEEATIREMESVLRALNYHIKTIERS